MKSLVTLIAILFTFSCCTASCSKDEETIDARNNEVGNINPSKMRITIGTTVFTAQKKPYCSCIETVTPVRDVLHVINGLYEAPYYFRSHQMSLALCKMEQ